FCGYMNYYQACAEFLESGGDCLLFAHPDDEFITEMKKMIDEGWLKMETLRHRAYRMLLFYNDYFNHSVNCPASLDFDPKKASFDMVEQSVTLFRDRPGILPIELSGKKTAHLIIADQYNLDIPKEFTEKLSSICQVDEFTDPGPEFCLRLAKSRDYDAIICTIGCAPWYGTNRIKLSGTIARNMMNGWTKYSTPVIFVDYAHPYIHEEYDAMIDTLIYTYGYNEYTVDKVIRLINSNGSRQDNGLSV
ncbi:MAG: hypothetical protein KBA26_10385, partial [Candidatus Delongbacteria bacterium]|nr:hypothetical protein [Candidatus Delongbacteria bacterium]